MDDSLYGLVEMDIMYGINAIRTTDPINGIRDIFAVNCKRMIFDTVADGVWYQLDPSKQVIPIESNQIFVPYHAILMISFNEHPLKST